MSKVLVEYDTGHKFGPASYESVRAFDNALKAGKGFFMYPYHGYELRMKVETEGTCNAKHT